MSRLAIAALLVVSAMAFSSEKGPAVFIRGWGNVIDPDGDCQVSVTGAKVTITVPASAHDFAAELQRWNSPRILRGVRGDFIAEVMVSGTFDPKPRGTIEGRKPYNGAGLLAIADNDNHVSLQRAAFWEHGHVRHYLNFELRHDGQSNVGRNGMNIPDDDCWLRLERRGGKMYAMTSIDGVNWKSYEPIDVNFPEELKVGVEAVNSAHGSFECGFEHYSLFRSGHLTQPPDQPREAIRDPEDAG